MSASLFLQKLINMRNATLKKGVCKKNIALESQVLQRVKAWYDAWHPNDAQSLNFIRKNSTDIMILLPGGNTAQAKSWYEKFQTLITQ